MKDRYLITITTLHGTKHYNIKQVIKHVLIGIVVFILLLLLGGYGYIAFLQSKIRDIEKEKQTLLVQSQNLQKRVQDLNKRLVDLNVALISKQEQMAKLSSKIADLETIMGMSSDEYDQILRSQNLSSDMVAKIFRLIPSGKPVDNIRISAGFGWRMHPILHKKEFHPGIDLADKGLVPIKATADGIVIQARHSRYGYGNVVKIAHVYGFTSLYGHMRSILVHNGEYVKKGQIIGYMGSTGLSTGQHLHYEVRFDKKPLNPLNFIRWSGQNFYKIMKIERHVPWESLIKAIQVAMSQKRLQSSQSEQ